MPRSEHAGDSRLSRHSHSSFARLYQNTEKGNFSRNAFSRSIIWQYVDRGFSSDRFEIAAPSRQGAYFCRLVHHDANRRGTFRGFECAWANGDHRA